MIQPTRSKAITAADKAASKEADKAEIKARAATGIVLMEDIFGLPDELLTALLLVTSEAEAKTIKGLVTDGPALLIKMPNALRILSVLRAWPPMRAKQVRFKKRLYKLAEARIGDFAALALTDLAIQALDGYIAASVLPECFTPAQLRILRRPFERAMGHWDRVFPAAARRE